MHRVPEHRKLIRADRLASIASTTVACQRVPEAEQQLQVQACPADEEIANAARAAGALPEQEGAAEQQPTAPLQHDEEDMDIDIMGLAETGAPARDLPTAGQPKGPTCSIAAVAAAPQLDVYEFDSKGPDPVPSARPCPPVLQSGLPTGHSAQEAHLEHAGACLLALAPKQNQPLLSATAHTDETVAQPVAQPDQVIVPEEAPATTRTAKRSRSVFGGEAESGSQRKAAKMLSGAAPRQALETDSSLSDAQLVEFAARAGQLWRDVRPLPG